MRTSEIDRENPLYFEALKLRHELFFKEFGLPESIVADELEIDSIHIAIADEKRLVAYGRLSEIESGIFKLSQIVVIPARQRRGYGSQLVRRLVDLAISRGATQIELNSQVAAKSLYSKLGFVEAGDVYPSRTTGIPHIKMVRANAR